MKAIARKIEMMASHVCKAGCIVCGRCPICANHDACRDTVRKAGGR